MSLESGRTFCIPDGYEVADRSLKDIQHVLDPQYTCARALLLAACCYAACAFAGLPLLQIGSYRMLFVCVSSAVSARSQLCMTCPTG
jgi:hypothetical protein